MSVIFKARTTDSYVIKILIELLQNNINIGCFVLKKNGISLRMMNTNKTILFNIDLDGEQFDRYVFTPKENMHIGLNLGLLYKMIRTIKKKDTIQFVINNKNINELRIKVIPKENNRVTTSCVKIQSTQNLKIDLPKNYSNVSIIQSNDYQKMCKTMSQIGNKIQISTKSNYVGFSCDTGELITRQVEFGSLDDSDSESENKNNETKKLLVQRFDIQRLVSTSKLASLSKRIHVLSHNDLPLCFKLNIGLIGKLSIFIKQSI